MNQEAATKVELSTKNSAKAENGGAPAPTIASLFQAKAEQDAKGTIAGAFVAGPDQPWNSRWVFGADKLPKMETLNATELPGGKPKGSNPTSIEELKKLVVEAAAAVQAQGGDESQLKSATESTMQEIDSAIAALGGELESVRTEVPGASSKGQMNALGGTEYLAALQGVKSAQSGGEQGGAMSGGMGGQTGDQAMAEQVVAGLSGANTPVKATKLAPGAKPDLQVIPGGISSGSRLEGGLKLSKEEPTLAGSDALVGGMPLSTAIRSQDQNVAIPPQVLTGHVVPGSMQRDRLTSESVRNMANSISGLSPNGGGEMRIKLNPGNLGELMIRVSTNGKGDVGLKVQATDSSAKKIIEESIGALRDSLASQSLALGRVDVTIATKNSQSTDMNSNPQGSPQQGMNGFDTQAGMQGRSNDRFYGNEDNSGSAANRGFERSSSQAATRVASLAAAAQSGSGARAASSRLDVMA